jgi:hypothetical protein
VTAGLNECVFRNFLSVNTNSIPRFVTILANTFGLIRGYKQKNRLTSSWNILKYVCLVVLVNFLSLYHFVWRGNSAIYLLEQLQTRTIALNKLLLL